MQVICDADKRIVGTSIGHAGSTADSVVYRQMPIYETPWKYLLPGEYLLADSAYPLSKQCITPYKAPAANIQENTEFNYCLAKSRVRNEHCIGILKSRWGSLQEMRTLICAKEDMTALIRWVKGCCVLHNMLAHLRDSWDEVFTSKQPLQEDEELQNEAQSDRDAEVFRESLKRTTININYERNVLPIPEIN